LREVSSAEQVIGLSINLSAQSLGINGIGKYVQDKLIEFNIDGSNITFEITETRALNNIEATAELIQQLRALGCRFALDDFGSGFSSFSHLKRLDVDFLKIDGAFTQGILDDSVDRAVIHAINSIAHSVGKRTTAEYVDRPELIAALKAAGVDFLQGYYIGRPLENLRQAVAQIAAPKASIDNSALVQAATLKPPTMEPATLEPPTLEPPTIEPPPMPEPISAMPIESPQIIPFPTHNDADDLAELDAFSDDMDLTAMALPAQSLLNDRLLGNG